MTEENTIEKVIEEVKRLKPEQTILVLNGSTDRTAQIVEKMRGISLIRFDTPLGHDVGRAVGASCAQADIYLFTDGDIVLKAAELYPFVQAIEAGFDIAMNNIDRFCRYRHPPATVIDRALLNILQNRSDLGIGNILSIPHAISRKALLSINAHRLSNPMLANAMLLEKNLRVTFANELDVVKKNRWRPEHLPSIGERMPDAYERIHGDAVETICELWIEKGEAEHSWNKRTIVGVPPMPKRKGDAFKGSLILCLDRESEQDLHRLQIALQAGMEIVPFVKRTFTEAMKCLEQYDVPYITLDEETSESLCYVKGAELALGNSLLFSRLSTLPQTAEEFQKFFNLPENPAIRMVDRQYWVGPVETMHPMHIAIYFLNITCRRNEWTVSSMLASPYSMNRKALDLIGTSTLANPLVAQMKAVHLDMMVELVNLTASESQLPPSFLSFDRELFLEALRYWTNLCGKRGGFSDGNRLRHIVPLN